MDRTISFVSDASQGTLDKLRGLVSKNKRRFTKNGFNLDLSYISNNIIAMGFPAEGFEGLYRNPMKSVQQLLNSEHPNQYKIFNLCAERVYKADKFERLAVYPIADESVPPLLDLQRFCEDVYDFLEEAANNVVVVHCKTGKSRTGMMIAAYLLHSGYCVSASQALAYFGTRRTLDTTGVTLPSQRRWVEYYERWLEDEFDLKFLSRLRYQLTHMHISSPPSGSSKLFLGISVAGRNVLYVRDRVTGNEKSIIVLDCHGIVLEGDVKFTLYQGSTKNILCSFWLNTMFMGPKITLPKSEIDGAHRDKMHKKFKINFRVTLLSNELKVSDDGKELVSLNATVPSSSKSGSVPPHLKTIQLFCITCGDAATLADSLLDENSHLVHWRCAVCASCKCSLALQSAAVLLAMSQTRRRMLCARCDADHCSECAQCGDLLHDFTSDNIDNLGSLCRKCFQCALCSKPFLNIDDVDYDSAADKIERLGNRLVCAIHNDQSKGLISKQEAARIDRTKESEAERLEENAAHKARAQEYLQAERAIVDQNHERTLDDVEQEMLSMAASGNIPVDTSAMDSRVDFEERLQEHKATVDDISAIIEDVLDKSVLSISEQDLADLDNDLNDVNTHTQPTSTPSPKQEAKRDTRDEPPPKPPQKPSVLPPAANGVQQNSVSIDEALTVKVDPLEVIAREEKIVNDAKIPNAMVVIDDDELDDLLETLLAKNTKELEEIKKPTAEAKRSTIDSPQPTPKLLRVPVILPVTSSPDSLVLPTPPLPSNDDQHTVPDDLLSPRTKNIKAGVIPRREPQKKVVLGAGRLFAPESNRNKRKSLMQTAPKPERAMDHLKPPEVILEDVVLNFTPKVSDKQHHSPPQPQPKLSVATRPIIPPQTEEKKPVAEKKPEKKPLPVIPTTSSSSSTSAGAAQPLMKLEPLNAQTPHCFGCRQPLSTAAAPTSSLFYITVNGRLRYYHPEHFQCTNCQRRILQHEEFMATDGKVHCYPCYIAQNAPRCATCKQAIVGQYREVVGLGCFHDQCFMCSKCHRRIGNDSFYCEGGIVTCMTCPKTPWTPTQ